MAVRRDIPPNINILSSSGLQSTTRVFVASLRDVSQLPKLAIEGLHTFTFSPAIADKLVSNDLTASAAADFERAARASRGELSA